MYCKNCGAVLNEDAKFCTMCGTKTEAPAAAQPNGGNAYGNAQYYGGYDSCSAPAYPVLELKTNRGLAKFILLNIITLGIYGIVVLSEISTSINTVASRYDRRKTMHYCLMYFLIAPLTAGIGMLVWYHNLSDRIGIELRRRNLRTEFSASTFWLWGFLGSLIIVGPFIYDYRLFKAMNELCGDYNQRGI